MRSYQLVVLIKPSLSETERKKILEGVKSSLKDAKVTQSEELGEKKLSYKIKGETSGYYYNLAIESENGVSSDIEKKLLVEEDVLRHLLIRRK